MNVQLATGEQALVRLRWIERRMKDNYGTKDRGQKVRRLVRIEGLGIKG